MKFLKKITSEEQIVEQNYNVLYCNETTNSVFFKKQVEPEVKITVLDSYTDTSIIGLTATKNIAVQGDIVWSTDLANGVAEIVNNTLRFLQHYEGTFKLTATASNAAKTRKISLTIFITKPPILFPYGACASCRNGNTCSFQVCRDRSSCFS